MILKLAALAVAFALAAAPALAQSACPPPPGAAPTTTAPPPPVPSPTIPSICLTDRAAVPTPQCKYHITDINAYNAAHNAWWLKARGFVAELGTWHDQANAYYTCESTLMTPKK